MKPNKKICATLGEEGPETPNTKPWRTIVPIVSANAVVVILFYLGVRPVKPITPITEYLFIWSVVGFAVLPCGAIVWRRYYPGKHEVLTAAMAAISWIMVVLLAGFSVGVIMKPDSDAEALRAFFLLLLSVLPAISVSWMRHQDGVEEVTKLRKELKDEMKTTIEKQIEVCEFLLNQKMDRDSDRTRKRSKLILGFCFILAGQAVVRGWQGRYEEAEARPLGR